MAKQKHKTSAQIEAEKLASFAKAAKEREEKAAAYVARLSGLFVRFTFIREVKQRAGLDEKEANAAFEKAVKTGRIFEAKRRGDVVIWTCKK